MKFNDNKSSISDCIINCMKAVSVVGVLLLAVVVAGQAAVISVQSIPQTQAQTERQLVFNDINAMQDGKVTLNVKNASLISSLREFASKVRVGIAFEAYLIPDKKVTVALRNASVFAALNELLKGTDLEAVLPPSRDVLVIRKKLKPIKAHLQAETITGTVTDFGTGKPLPGVNIRVKGTTIGTNTDAEGQYDLEGPSLQDTLIFSFVGFQQQEIAIGGRSEINVALREEAYVANELVVTALGVTKERRAVAYSTSEVKGQNLTKARETNVVNSLAGRMAGVTVQGNATGPGGSSRIIIRGNTSLAGDNQPLYVVNGMPINNSRQGDQGPQGRTVYGDRGDGISMINPSDIESMNVLKGGQATALYGSRASNGVVLITTKEGSGADGFGIQFTSNSMFKSIAKYPDWQQQYGHGTAYEIPQSQTEAASEGRLSFGPPVDENITYTGINGERPYAPVSIKSNMNDFYQTGTQFTNSLAFTGGAENYNYRVSLSNLDAKSMMPNSSYNRKNANLNLNADVSDKISVSSFVQYNLVDGENRPQGGYATFNANWGVKLLANTMDISDLSPGFYEESPGQEMLWNPSSAAPNPYWITNKYSNEDNEERFIGNVKLTYNVMDNLMLQGYVGQDFRNFNGSYVIPTGTAYRPDGVYNTVERNLTETNSQLTINYDGAILENFNLSVMAGGKRENQEIDSKELDGQEFIVPYFYSYTNLATTVNNNAYQETATNSVFGSAELDYNDMVYLTVTGRQDWFSTLNPDNNSIFYPSIGGSLVISDIFQMPNAINFFKLRGSWAKVGSAIVPPYVTNESYSFQEGGFGGESVQILSGIPTPGLVPLEKTTYEVGFDLELFESRLAIDLSLYNSITRQDIVTTEIARSSGYGTTRVNVGELNNKGIEFMMQGYPVEASNFTWNTNFNISYNKSEIRQLADGLDQITLGSQIGGGSIRHKVGRPYGMIWGAEYMRNDNGEIVFNRNSGLPVAVEEEQGRSVPPLTMGLSNSFSYNNLSLGILFDARFGSAMYSNTWWYAYRMGLPKETLQGRENGLQLSGVDQQGEPFERTIPRNDLRSAWYNNGGDYAGRFVHENPFIKLREVTLSYNLPQRIIDYVSLQSATLSLVGRNLLALYDPMPHVDPEAGNTSSNLQGLEGFGVPYGRTVGFNVSLNF